MAHRGSRLLWPENTMVAFQGAADLGIQYFETDLHATRDGILLTFHDQTLQRTTDATGKVLDRTLAELREVDAGHRFEIEGDFPHRGTGVHIPTLEEVITTFPDVVVTVDLKAPDLEPLLVEFCERHDAWDRLIVGSFIDTRTWRVRKLTQGRVATSATGTETSRVLAASRFGMNPTMPGDVYQIPETAGPLRVVDRRFLRAAHANRIPVHVWTVNDPQRMEELLDLGVDGIITDRPDLLRDLMIRRGVGGPWNR